jgi:hypothetical protein
MGYGDRDDPPSPSSSPCTFDGKRFTMGGKKSSPFEEFFVTPYTSSDLIAAYIGQSGPKTQALLTRHVEKVLFIDEAYTIGEQGSFSDEIMPILLTFAEKNQGGSVIIMAGYANRMQEFFRLNEGLATTNFFLRSSTFIALSHPALPNWKSRLFISQERF